MLQYSLPIVKIDQNKMKYHSEAAPSVQLRVLYITNLSERRTGLGMDIFV